MHTGEYILIVDDDTEDHLILQLFFEDRGLAQHVLFIDSGQEALNFLRRAADRGTLPKLVVLDLNMPMLNGVQILACIRQTESIGHLPVIILSTSENERDRRQIMNLGAIDYVVKPINLDEGRALVGKLVAYIEVST